MNWLYPDKTIKKYRKQSYTTTLLYDSFRLLPLQAEPTVYAEFVWYMRFYNGKLVRNRSLLRRSNSIAINKMIENVQYESWTTMDGDDTSYSVSGFDPNIMLPDEDVYKPKKKPSVKTKGLETFMKEDI